MGLTFRYRELKALAEGRWPRGLPPDIAQRARRKLFMLVNAAVLDDLRSPPGNRLEALAGDRAGYHSIRINDQWRICFRWTENGPKDIEITDYQ